MDSLREKGGPIFSEPEVEIEVDGNEEDPPELPEWLIELPDTLDVHIAQREFESAVEIIQVIKGF